MTFFDRVKVATIEIVYTIEVIDIVTAVFIYMVHKSHF